MRGLVLGAEAPGADRVYQLRVGDAEVAVTAASYDPVTEERARLRLGRASEAADDTGALLALLAPGAAEALARLDGEALAAAAPIWLAAMIGPQVVRSWSGVLSSDGQPLDWTVEHWQLACFTVPGFARAFLSAWLSPRTLEIQAGNA
jgi:hypothetical protein